MFSVFKKKPDPVRARRKPHDVVEFDELVARMWQRNDPNGKRCVSFSLHKYAQVRGEGLTAVNNFDVTDVTSLVGLCQSLCEWYLLDKSTPEVARQELDTFNTVLSEFRTYALGKAQQPAEA